MANPIRRNTRPFPALAVALALLTAAASAGADETRTAAAFSLDNDYFTGTDRHYTNGFYYSQASFLGRQELHPWLEPVADFLAGGRSGPYRHAGWSLGQLIFTPENEDLVFPAPTDRPYAGWLGGTGWLGVQDGALTRQLGLSLGIVGPAALGEEVQDTVHSITGDQEFRGWDQQLENEPTLNLHFRQQHRLVRHQLTGNWTAEAFAEGGADVGNLSIAGLGRFLLRVGIGLPSDYQFPTERFGPSHILRRETGNRHGDWRFALFGGGEVRAVAHNIFLDGNTFEDSASVAAEPLVGSGVFGAEVGWKRFAIRQSFVFRTQEFEGQGDKASYGSLTVAWEF